MKHKIIISWDPSIGAITASGQLLRTVRFVVRKKNYLETKTANTKFSPPRFCSWSHTYKGRPGGHCHPNSSTMFRSRGKSLPTGLTGCLFLVAVNEPVSRIFLSPEKATWHCLIHSEHVMWDPLTPLTLSFGNWSAVEIKSGNLRRFNIDPEHHSHNMRELGSSRQHNMKVDCYKHHSVTGNLCLRLAERSPLDTWMGRYVLHKWKDGI